MRLAFSPDWFLSFDVIIEIFSFIVLMLFFIFAIKSYKITKNKNSLYIGIGFLIISLAEISTILTKLVLYYDFFFAQAVGQVVLTYKIVRSVDIFYYIGSFLHKFLTLTGLYVLYRIPWKKTLLSDIALAVYFILLSAYFGVDIYYLFHLTVVIFLTIITLKYYKIYQKNKSENTRKLMIAFGILMISHLIFILSNLPIMYVIGQLTELVSYVILLALMIKLFWKNKKEYG